MTTNKAIEVLAHYVRWRKGEAKSIPDPRELGEAIEVAVERMSTKQERKRKPHGTDNADIDRQG